ncbi:hypothetical protein [Microbacterium sediminis]|uniref:hypothetical protein n=1 Tax=Microbacterium sediminis TaxID=904291 RepID=UPI001FD00B5C|nr:hypothetical protein [Microbacterium sediminis]
MGVRWPATITLALTAWAMEVVIGVALGLFAGLRQGRLFDRTVLAGTISPRASRCSCWASRCS